MFYEARRVVNFFCALAKMTTLVNRTGHSFPCGKASDGTSHGLITDDDLSKTMAMHSDKVR